MRRLERTRTLPPSVLKGEAEGSRDVGEVQRNLGLLDQPCGENSAEGFQNVQGTRLEEIDLFRTQPLQGKNQNRL